MIKIVQVPIGKLKGAKYNPRKWDDRQTELLEQSIREFGVVDPIIVNGSVKRKNIIIGGHFRVTVAKKMGIKQVPVVYVDIPDEAKERELNLRLNKNLGEWDWELLHDFDPKMLEAVGFDEGELKMWQGIGNADDEQVDPERMMVLTVLPPEAPKLKERALIHCDTIEQYRKIKRAVEGGTLTAEQLESLA